MALRLNIGAGDTTIDGFIPIDRQLGTEAYPLNYGDNSVDEIRASHVLEHFGFDDVPKVLGEWSRVLKPGARMRIAVPDFDKITGMRSDARWPLYLMGGQTDSNDYHRSVFTSEALQQAMERAGLGDVRAWESDNTDSASHPCSLNLEGVKLANENATLKITAIMSVPRLGFNDNWGCIVDALRPFKIPVRRFTGVFWGQCMQAVLEDCLKDGLDWVLAVDYDSMFTSQHLDTLMGIFGANPDIDALAALQCRRAGDTPLCAIKGQAQVAVDGSPIKVHTAHFGLTLLRVPELKDIEKPWFKGEPDKDGGWSDEGRMDPDIWFWHQWRKAGKTVYTTPMVRIGHLSVMVGEFDENMKHRYVTTGDWYRREKPESGSRGI